MLYKKFLSKAVRMFICILLCISTLPVYATADFQDENVSIAGEWVLDGAPEYLPVEYLEPVGQPEEDGTGFTTARTVISAGSASYYDREIKYVNYDNTIDESVSEAQFIFTALPERLRVGETLEFTINGTFTGFSTNNFYSGHAFMMYEAVLYDKTGDFHYFSAFNDNSDLTLTQAKTDKAVCTMTVPEWYEENDSLKIACSVGGDAARQIVIYTYRFKNSNQRPFVLGCEIYDVRCNPMPYLNVVISGQISDGFKVTNLGSEQLQTDITGALEWKTEVPWNVKGKLEIRIDMSLQCWMKDAFASRSDKTAYYLRDLKNAADVPVSFATIIEMDMESPEFSGQESIWLGRHINFGFLKTKDPALSYADKDKPDRLDYEGSDPVVLPAMSYIYNQLFSALYTGVKVFEEKEALLETAPILAVDCNYTAGTSHFTTVGTSPRIRLDLQDMILSDHARYDVLHEFGHYFDWVTGGSKFHCLPANASLVNENHGGYMNDTTSDSVLEGFASWYACNVQKYGFFPVARPDVMGLFGSIADPTLPWVENGIREEFSIARAFWSVETALGAKDIWKLALQEHYSSLSGYYSDFLTAAAFLAEGNETAEQTIKKAFYENGLYRLGAGNGSYDPTEPFRDSLMPLNARYDPTELFADLPATLPASESLASDLGSPSDSGRTRNSSYKLENSYIELSGAVPEFVKVTVRPEGKQAWACLEGVFNGKVYIGLPQGGGSGSVEISIPGGETVFTGEIGELHDKLLKTFGQDVVLTSVNVPQSALADESVIPGPTDGSPDAPGILIVDESLKQLPAVLTVSTVPFYDIAEDELQKIIEDHGSIAQSSKEGSPEEEDNNSQSLMVSGTTGGNGTKAGGNSGGGNENDVSRSPDKGGNFTLLLIIGVVVILIIIILIAAARKKPKTPHEGYSKGNTMQNRQNVSNSGYSQSPVNQQQNPQNAQSLQNRQPEAASQQIDSPFKFCRECGQPLRPDGGCGNCKKNICSNCGAANQTDSQFCVKCGSRLQ